MNDNISIQYAMYRGLRSCATFAPVNVELYLRELTASQISRDALWQKAGLNGQTGVGFLIPLPSLRFPKANGLQRERHFEINIVEHRDFNFTAAAPITVAGAADAFLNGVYTLAYPGAWSNGAGGNLIFNGTFCYLADNAGTHYWEAAPGGTAAFPALGMYATAVAGSGSPPAVTGFVGGTFKTADDWVDDVIDFFWNWHLQRAGGFVPSDAVATPMQEFEEGSGIVGFSVQFMLRQERRPPARAGNVTIAVDGARQVTLSVSDGSLIYYTLDGFSPPMPDNTGALFGETAATLYTGPFTVPANTTVLAMAWNATIPNPGQLASLLIT